MSRSSTLTHESRLSLCLEPILSLLTKCRYLCLVRACSVQDGVTIAHWIPVAVTRHGWDEQARAHRTLVHASPRSQGTTPPLSRRIAFSFSSR